MTERELSELEEAVGEWTKAEQRRMLREVRRLQEERAGLYCDLFLERRKGEK